MTLVQSLIPSNFVKKPTKKFIRRQKLYLKNKKKAQINRRVDQLMVEQLARTAKKQLFIAPIHTPSGELLVASDYDTGHDSDFNSPQALP
jgi:hypothetical protein